VLTISDRCSAGDAVDRSGPEIIESLPMLESRLIHREIVPDEIGLIRAAAERWVNRCELLVSTGGTGVAARDVTPEALAPVITRGLPGFGEVMRLKAFEKQPMAVVSRGGAGLADRTLVIWLPGSPKAVRECIEWLAPAIRHVCQFLRGERPH
jgi:molybdenum cofactor synthesis domain-containing protein